MPSSERRSGCSQSSRRLSCCDSATGPDTPSRSRACTERGGEEGGVEGGREGGEEEL